MYLPLLAPFALQPCEKIEVKLVSEVRVCLTWKTRQLRGKVVVSEQV